MSDNKMQLYQPTSALMNSTNQSAITELANRLMKFPPSNKSMSFQDAAQLAVFSIMVDANPYAGEVYASPIGPQLGIPLFRRKAKEWNRMMGGNDDWDYKVNYRPAKDHEANFDATKGDVAWICELTDTKAEKEWQDSYVRFFNLAIEAGAEYKQADERALMFAGPRPVWTGTGVVGGNEHFSDVEVDEWGTSSSGKKYPKTFKNDENGNPVYKQEMFDRNERAQKRAEKLALKKRYPDLIIPEFSEVQTPEMKVLIENAEGSLVEAEEIKQTRTPAEKRSLAQQAALDLGLDPDEIIESEIEEGEFVDAPPVDPAWNPVENAADIYEKVTDSKGTLYKDKDISSLNYSYNALNKKIKAFAIEEGNQRDIDALDELKLKRDAVHYYMNLKKE